jgi:hypothetical protein
MTSAEEESQPMTEDFDTDSSTWYPELHKPIQKLCEIMLYCCVYIPTLKHTVEGVTCIIKRLRMESCQLLSTNVQDAIILPVKVLY